MEPSNYDGPGIYLHHKGGHYRVLGVARPEADGPLVVVYHGYSIEMELERYESVVDFITRPLHSALGVDAFNDFVFHDGDGRAAGASLPRFKKVYR